MMQLQLIDFDCGGLLLIRMSLRVVAHILDILVSIQAGPVALMVWANPPSSSHSHLHAPRAHATVPVRGLQGWPRWLAGWLAPGAVHSMAGPPHCALRGISTAISGCLLESYIDIERAHREREYNARWL